MACSCYLPPLLAVVLRADIADVLQGIPAEDGVVSDEWSTVSGSDSVTNLTVYEVREEGDTLFEVGFEKSQHRDGFCDVIDLQSVTFMTPDACCKTAHCGLCSISLTSSSKQSRGTLVSESMIKM